MKERKKRRDMATSVTRLSLCSLLTWLMYSRSQIVVTRMIVVGMKVKKALILGGGN